MKEVYVVPETLPVMISSESMVCTSPTDIVGDRIDYGDPITIVW